MAALVEGERFMVAPANYSCMFGKVIWRDAEEAIMHFSDGSQSSDFSESHEDWLRIEPDETIAYLAGPMRGYEYYNAPAFILAYRCLLRNGYDYIINPISQDYDAGFDYYDLPKFHDWNEAPLGFSMEQAASRCLQSIAIADEIVMLPGWRDSRGATAEYHVAVWLSKRILELEFMESDAGELGFELSELGKASPKKARGSLYAALSAYSRKFFNGIMKG